LLEDDLEALLRCMNAVVLHQIWGTEFIQVRVPWRSLCVTARGLQRAEDVEGRVLWVALTDHVDVVALDLDEFFVDACDVVNAAGE